VLRSVCQQNIQWQNEGSPPIPIAVNISCIQFPQRDLFDTIAQILEETGLEARYLECELTESTIMQNEEEAAKTLKRLKMLGIKLSIDDFGVGYSSLSYLRQLALDTLKIDKSFIRDVPDEPDGMALSIAIIAMAHSLGLNVVAEGVETRQQLNFLRENDCDQAQGFLFSPARPADEIPTLLAKGLPQYQPGYREGF
jgi:EAL domain-containing protein (putative c-di-GMP-specific phosphodiesterase class I)